MACFPAFYYLSASIEYLLGNPFEESIALILIVYLTIYADTL